MCAVHIAMVLWASLEDEEAVPLKKPSFPDISSYQLPIVPYVEIELLCYLPFCGWVLSGTYIFLSMLSQLLWTDPCSYSAMSRKHGFLSHLNILA